MRRLWSMAVIATMVLAGCGDDGAGPGNTFDPSVCPDPVVIASAADLVEVLASAEWDVSAPYGSVSSPPSPDLLVSGTVVLESGDVPLPASCLDRADCRHRSVMQAAGPGVEVQGGGSLFEGDTRLVLTDTTVRLTTTLMDTHPGPFNYVPVVSVTGPCGEPCDGGAFACASDLQCYAAYEAYCLECEARPAEECVCRTEEGPLDDGEHCEFFVSGDQILVGTCRSGRCETSG